MEILSIPFPRNIGARPDWTSLERTVGMAIVKACLLSPRSQRKRDRYITGLLFNKLDAIFDAGDRDLARFVIDRMVRDPKDFGKLSPISDYEDRLLFRVPGRKERSRDLIFMRSILSVGLTLKLLASMPATRGRTPRLEDAQELLADKYGHILKKNEAYRREAWFKWRHVAHLCAALVDHLPDGPVVDAAFWGGIEDNLPDFLAVAKVYERFITTPAGDRSRRLSRQILEKIHLLTISSSVCVGSASRYASEVPSWDRKNHP